MNIQQLIGEGFKEYPHPFREASMFLQKGIEDEIGKKYFIDCFYNKIINEETSEHKTVETYTFEVQMESDYGTVSIETVQWFNTFDGVLYSQKTLPYVYEYFETMWIAHGMHYYEEF